MKKNVLFLGTIMLSMFATCYIVALSVYAQANAPVPFYPVNYELLCATGSFPVSMAANGVASTWNVSTSKWRANVCVDGNGNVTYPGVVSTPGGSNTQIQYNNNGAFGGSSQFTIDGLGRLEAANPSFICLSNCGAAFIAFSNPGIGLNGPINLTGNPKGRLLLADQGQCTMSSGACSAQSLSSTYANAPNCFLSWTGTGTLAGQLKVASSTTTVTPSSSTGTDTAQVNWVCFGN